MSGKREKELRPPAILRAGGTGWSFDPILEKHCCFLTSHIHNLGIQVVSHEIGTKMKNLKS